MGKVIPPLDDMADLWARYEADGPSPPPLPLANGYGLADFTAALAALKAAYTAYGSADNALGLSRGRRNVTQEAKY